MLPVVDQALQQKQDIVFACINPQFKLKEDFRVKYLSDNYRLKTFYLHQIYQPNLLYHVFTAVVCKLSNLNTINRINILSPIVRKTRNIIHDRLINRLYDIQWAKDMLTASDIGCVVVDYVKIDRYIYKPIKEACVQRGIPIISIPHGFDTTYNDTWTTKTKAAQDFEWKGRDWEWIDKIIVASEGIADKYTRHGVDPSKMKVLGLPRFTPQWTDIYHSMIPQDSIIKETDERLKIVFFDHNSNTYRGNPEAIYTTLKKLDQLPYINLIIKPHTRNRLSDPRLLTIGTINYSHSVNLIQWCDIVINYLSSIVLDALLLNKLFAYPKYFSDNTMRWEQYKACWTFESEDELLAGIEAIYQQTQKIPYSSINIEEFFKHEIYGNSDPNVSGKYLEYINLNSV